VGTTRISDALGPAPLFAAYERFGLGPRIPAAARTNDAAMARFAYGADLAATSVEIARGYLVLARGGTTVDGARVVSSETAATTVAALEAAVARPDATGRRAAIDGVRVAGKTETMPVEGGGSFGVFVGIVPADAPSYVILVGVETTTDGDSGGTLAAPSFARVARGIL
jgi:cell division protein FtsI (penicillin-binding protein 3)